MNNKEGGGPSPEQPRFDQVNETPAEFSWRTSRGFSIKEPKPGPVLGSLENFGLEEIRKHQEGTKKENQ